MLFLIASAATMMPVVIYVTRNQKLKNSLMFWLSLSVVIITNAFLFLFIWILTGENYISLFLGLIVVTVAMMLLVEFLWLLMGSRDVPWAARTFWASYEFRQRARVFNKALQVTLAIIILVIFPLYIGLGFFRQAFTQEEWTRYVFRATLLLLFAAPQLGFLPGVVFVLTSENIHGDTRSRIFIAQLSSAISLLLLTSLFIWSIGGAGRAVPILGGNFVFSPTVLYVMLA